MAGMQVYPQPFPQALPPLQAQLAWVEKWPNGQVRFLRPGERPAPGARAMQVRKRAVQGDLGSGPTTHLIMEPTYPKPVQVLNGPNIYPATLNKFGLQPGSWTEVGDGRRIRRQPNVRHEGGDIVVRQTVRNGCGGSGTDCGGCGGHQHQHRHRHQHRRRSSRKHKRREVEVNPPIQDGFRGFIDVPAAAAPSPLEATLGSSGGTLLGSYEYNLMDAYRRFERVSNVSPRQISANHGVAAAPAAYSGYGAYGGLEEEMVRVSELGGSVGPNGIFINMMQSAASQYDNCENEVIDLRLDDDDEVDIKVAGMQTTITSFTNIDGTLTAHGTVVAGAGSKGKTSSSSIAPRGVGNSTATNDDAATAADNSISTKPALDLQHPPAAGRRSTLHVDSNNNHFFPPALQDFSLVEVTPNLPEEVALQKTRTVVVKTGDPPGNNNGGNDADAEATGRREIISMTSSSEDDSDDSTGMDGAADGGAAAAAAVAKELAFRRAGSVAREKAAEADRIGEMVAQMQADDRAAGFNQSMVSSSGADSSSVSASLSANDTSADGDDTSTSAVVDSAAAPAAQARSTSVSGRASVESARFQIPPPPPPARQPESITSPAPVPPETVARAAPPPPPQRRSSRAGAATGGGDRNSTGSTFYSSIGGSASGSDRGSTGSTLRAPLPRSRTGSYSAMKRPYKSQETAEQQQSARPVSVNLGSFGVDTSTIPQGDDDAGYGDAATGGTFVPLEGPGALAAAAHELANNPDEIARVAAMALHDTRIHSDWSIEQVSECLARASMDDAAEMVLDHALCGDDVLHLHQQDVQQDIPLFEEPDRRNLIRFFHTPAYLPHAAWSTFQCSAWLTLYGEFDAGTVVELNKITGEQFVLLSEDGLAALGVRDVTAREHLAQLIKNGAPEGNVGRAWCPNDVQAWFKDRGIYPITEPAIDGRDLLHATVHDVEKMGASDRIIREAIWEELHPSIELDETLSAHSWSGSEASDSTTPANTIESSGEMIARDPNMSVEWLEEHQFQALAQFSQTQKLALRDVFAFSKDELSHLGLPDGEANRFVQIAANSSRAILTPSEVAAFLADNNLPQTSSYFAEHTLDGVDMLYMLPSDMLNDNILLDECQRFARLIAQGDAANWLFRNNYRAMSKVARDHGLDINDFQHVTHQDVSAYGVPASEIDRFLKFFGKASEVIV